MKHLFFSIVFCSILFPANAQKNNAASHLIADASKMKEAFLKEDYNSFTHYTHPAVLQKMGGAPKVVAVMIKTTQDMQKQGLHFSAVNFDEPSPIYTHGNELQATIAQHLEVKVPQGKMIVTSTLIAISIDKGEHWTFIDTSNKDMLTLRKILPNLSDRIIIPPTKKPEFVKGL